MSSARLVCCVLLATCATVGSAQTEWTLDPAEPVLEPAPEGAWDHGLRLIEAVVEVDGVYHMFYRGQPDPTDYLFGTFSIGHATSGDGVAWTLDPANPVLSPGTGDDWDHGSIRGAAVIHDGSRFRMWYASVIPSDTILDDIWLGVGHATSTDGSTWSRSPENPIISPGSYGTFAIPQTVLFDGESFRMWYLVSPGYGCEYPASSSDGMGWGGFLYSEPDWLPPLGLSVVDDGTNYYMMKWTEGWVPMTWGGASPNGLSWSNFIDYPLIYAAAASPAMLVDGDTFVMWYSSFDGIHRATSTCCDTTYAWFVLAAASGAGAAGSFYRTEVEINNASDGPADYRLAWFPRDRDNSQRIRSGTFQVGSGKSVRYADVLTEVFGLGAGSFGALAVEATTEDVIVAARISSSDGQTAGTYGQEVPIVRVDEFYSYTFPGKRILFGTENANERFNITCFFGRGRAWSSGVDVEFELRDRDGALLGTESLHLLPFGSGQLNRVFAGYRPVEGYVEIRNGYGTSCFGSRIDNRTNDPTTILPR